MPPIIITPGTFNPPATPVENAGIFIFAKQPDVTLNRRPQQSSRGRVVGFPPLPALPGLDVEFALWNPYYVAFAGPRTDSATTFRVMGARYVPDGIYSDDYVTGDFYGDYLNAPLPRGDYLSLEETQGYYVPEAQVSGFINYTYEIQITLVGCTDGATYEVDGLWPGLSEFTPLTHAGGGVWTAVATDTAPVPSTVTGEGSPVADPTSLTQFGRFRLRRNSQLYDEIYIDAGGISQMIYAPVLAWVPEDYGAVDGPELQAIELTLYGPNATPLQLATAAVTPSALGVTEWARTSHATQGTLTLL